jgi:hypothetical protein
MLSDPKIYIYERNPDTGEIFRRIQGDYDSPRELINPEVNAVPNIDYESAALNLNGQEWMNFIDSLTNKQKIQLSRCWD